eukprot:5988363-Prorocentrum_lima.AAC.1
MTSSLVGSEMCIRDRRCVCDVHLPRGDREEYQIPFHNQKEEPSPSRLRKAVSYTHLTLPTICSV